jgi:lipase ATG15
MLVSKSLSFLHLTHIITDSVILKYSIRNNNKFSNIKYFDFVSFNEFTYKNVYSLANMAKSTYYNLPINYFVDIKTNKTLDVGISNDTVHAYLFSNNDYSQNVIAFKGTSLGLLENSSKNDKFNDNLFFSCCFYEQSSMFNNEHCECKNDRELCYSRFNRHFKFKFVEQKSCYTKCYKNSTSFLNNYYKIAINIVENTKKIIQFDKNKVLFTGHSLGGTLSTLMGITYNFTSVSFQSPGEKHYIDLLNLYYDDTILQNIYNIGHNADTIYTGKCNGLFSWCYLAGYIIETKCHIGNVCDYDVINKLGISESIITHPIKYVIDNIITQWKDDNDNQTLVLPKCIFKPECDECQDWKYI